MIEVEKGKVVTKEKYDHFPGNYKKMRLQLKEAKAKAVNCLCQLSFISMIRGSTWADGLHLGFKTYRTWLKDPAGQ